MQCDRRSRREKKRKRGHVASYSFDVDVAGRRSKNGDRPSRERHSEMRRRDEYRRDFDYDRRRSTYYRQRPHSGEGKNFFFIFPLFLNTKQSFFAEIRFRQQNRTFVVGGHFAGVGGSKERSSGQNVQRSMLSFISRARLSTFRRSRRAGNITFGIGRNLSAAENVGRRRFISRIRLFGFAE